MTEKNRSPWHELVEKKVNRRSLLLGAATVGTSAALASAVGNGTPTVSAAPVVEANNAPLHNPRLIFTPIGPSSDDQLLLPPGYEYQMVAPWGQALNNGDTIGFNHDWTGFYPIDFTEKAVDLNALHKGFLSREMSSTDGLLVINHEYVNPLFVSGYDEEVDAIKNAEQIDTEQAAVGLSVLHVQRSDDGTWNIVDGAPENRRIDATTPMLMTGPAAELDGGPEAIGTLANCSGGMTPWGTALSCEENYQNYPVAVPDGYGWDPEIYGKRHYGWIVEVDPFAPASTPRKHTAMGRFRHENVAVQVAEDGTVVAYMGDDRGDACVYKFVADQKLTDPSDRASNLSILESGKLYVANFGAGEWVLLDYETSAVLQEAVNEQGNPLFASQADVLANARDAALELGGTPVDRPEDIEVHPLDRSVYVALTNNTSHGNFHGQIVRMTETEPAATTFQWSIFAVGGPQSGFSSPDNMIFDDQGNLWMVTDISTSRQNKGIYAFQGNNALFFFHTTGPLAGHAFQFASGPVESELTGLSWTPDGQTMFLSIQHPGERSTSLEELTSNWPNSAGEVPQPATVAITGFPA